MLAGTTFPVTIKKILARLDGIFPKQYAGTRNFIDGYVTYLSPYISRGVISTKYVLKSIIENGIDPLKVEKFTQELAWRDYWQQIWIAKGNLIDEDLKNKQSDVENNEMPQAIIKGKTTIKAIDNAIKNFYKTGYIHNHMRMYIASLACNVGKSHWKVPAQWMYYHLLDGDWASNALSWQWVSGSNSHKKYYANQQNVNRYMHTQQKNTFLSVDYKSLVAMQVPEVLKPLSAEDLKVSLPPVKKIILKKNIPTLIYNYYNLDPFWRKDQEANRILLLEPSHFAKYPVSPKSIDFMLDLGKNIKGLKVFTGEFGELKKRHALTDIFYKEHPTNKHYVGKEDSRDWMFTITGYYPSFFNFWKQCRKELKQIAINSLQ